MLNVRNIVSCDVKAIKIGNSLKIFYFLYFIEIYNIYIFYLDSVWWYLV